MNRMMTTVHLPFFVVVFLFFSLGIYRTVEAFIRSKYERKQYLKKDGLPPTRSTSSSAKETKSSDKVMGNDRGSSVAVWGKSKDF